MQVEHPLPWRQNEREGLPIQRQQGLMEERRFGAEGRTRRTETLTEPLRNDRGEKRPEKDAGSSLRDAERNLGAFTAKNPTALTHFRSLVSRKPKETQSRLRFSAAEEARVVLWPRSEVNENSGLATKCIK